MKSRMMVENPDDVEVTIKMTMRVKDWAELRDQLANAYPAWELSSHINSMLSQIRKIVYPEELK